jgi:hypothetical protein
MKVAEFFRNATRAAKQRSNVKPHKNMCKEQSEACLPPFLFRTRYVMFNSLFIKNNELSVDMDLERKFPSLKKSSMG